MSSRFLSVRVGMIAKTVKQGTHTDGSSSAGDQVMATQNTPVNNQDVQTSGSYLHGAVAGSVMEYRTAEKEGQFLLPYVKPGARLLDCGCGPGTITTGFAKRTAPGEVVGIDFDRSQVDRATSLAAEAGVGNVQFCCADVNQLPFEDESFDVVYMHTILEHLDDPMKAINEARRVLRKGGVLGARHSDSGTWIFWPGDQDVIDAWSLYAHYAAEATSSNLWFGRTQDSLLKKAGFSSVSTSSSGLNATRAVQQAIGKAMQKRLLGSDIERWALQSYRASREDLLRMSTAFGEFFENPESNAYALKIESICIK